MSSRDSLHRLVEELPDVEIARAERVLLALVDDPLIRALHEAPDDDEPETPEEHAAVEEARSEADRGELVPHEEAMRRLGLP